MRTNLSLIDSQIRALFPKDDIRLSQANGSVVISGSVVNAATAAQVQSVVEAAGFKTVNMLTSPVNGVTQVQLQVRVAEVNRNRMREYGTSFLTNGNSGGYANSGGGPSMIGESSLGALTAVMQPALNLLLFNKGINTAAMLKVLRTQGAFRELAEPNLIAMNGSEASFLAGGEFPVPVLQNAGSGGNVGITIVWKEYGIRLKFKPTIIDEDHIRLELEPEVSTIDFANGVRFSGFVIPALRTRRARTGVELRDGQSFALAGLLDNNETRSLSKIPVLGDIPILGNLFKSSSFQKQESELMFIITAELVKPLNSDELPQMKGVDGIKGGSPLGIEPAGDGISGRSGFSTSGDAAATLPEVTPAAPATGAPANTTVPANAAPSTDTKPKTAAPQPVATPGTPTKGATP